MKRREQFEDVKRTVALHTVCKIAGNVALFFGLVFQEADIYTRANLYRIRTRACDLSRLQPPLRRSSLTILGAPSEEA